MIFWTGKLNLLVTIYTKSYLTLAATKSPDSDDNFFTRHDLIQGNAVNSTQYKCHRVTMHSSLDFRLSAICQRSFE